MIRNPIDISGRVSPELSSLIQGIIDQLDTDEPITLSAVRSFIVNDLPAEIDESEEMHHFDVDESLIDELDVLIDQFGESAVAVDFVHAFASEALSRAIDALMDDQDQENPVTLSEVRDAIVDGLGSRLVGDGVLEEDEADMLMPEIESLIEHYGPDAPAEDFLRYE
ncbi:MAG: hypothetical protein ACM3W8_05705 [Sideroxydans sp.]|nr:hypothetical protein [Sideroxyarcus sp.]